MRAASAGTEVEIRQTASFPWPEKALQEREVGRILVRGPGLMRDYDQQPEESAATLSSDGWLDTGDLGYFVNGQLVITGRART
jgi:fatty-acyl-CoA synthase